MLEQVKTALGITGEYQDTLIQLYIDEAIQFMIDGGIPEDVATSDKCIGIVTRGVSDLWNYGSGEVSLSPYFLQRVTQLALKYGGGNDGELSAGS